MTEASAEGVPLAEPLMGLSRISKTIDGSTFAYIQLDCIRKSIGSIKAIETYPHLRQIDLSGNVITDVAPLQELLHVLTLKLSGNAIRTLEPWGPASLVHLMLLDLSENQLEALPPIFLPALKSASFANNSIATCKGFAGHATLERLDLSGNKLAALEGLGAMPKLRSLRLAKNAIVSTQGLAGLPALKDMDLSANELEVLDGPWDGVPNLEILDVSSNKLGWTKEVEEGEEGEPAKEPPVIFGGINTLVKLNKLQIEANAVSELGNVRLEVLICHNGLGDIDGTPVEQEERDQARDLNKERLAAAEEARLKAEEEAAAAAAAAAEGGGDDDA